MPQVFLFAVLCHPMLARAVLGAVPQGTPARLAGHLLCGGGWAGPGLEPSPGGEVTGSAIEPDPEALARLEFFTAALGGGLEEVEFATGHGVVRGLTPVWNATGPGIWDPERWQAQWAEAAVCMAAEIVGYRDEMPACQVQAALQMMLVRWTSLARARAEETPMQVRQGFTDADVDASAPRRPYRRFFAMEEHDLRFRTFGGGMSPQVERAGFVSGDASTVLPYDPVRDRVLVIEQFRYGPLLRGDRRPWSLEAIAGRVDPGETPEDCAMREALEETGIDLQRLVSVGNYYPSPGAVSEYLFSYVGLADLPDGAASIGGVQSEAEDIRGILLGFDELMHMLKTGEAQNGPLILSALWLAANREMLRGGA
ncbi:MAG: NUDIX domain-containing protein [Rhodobacteraceae bacterium]|nr:NUDIX domain-containing protein [Paracoccaceae bacterium]